ncbi:M15 family metallopeptidase [Olleya sp. YS]|uniref:M15 family metallopeptidase n=1 Tax=Olleya sp. YS TaxID=3028318 RepID=UPI0024343175|nr:M15 family metallopeptidase [Olleya sp. YS]WGD35351.1 M15 family metallopeptidase [Olleya sp. YS]
MNRKNLITCLILALVTFTVFPQFAFYQYSISADELMGKGTPQLFGEQYKLREAAHLAFKKMQAAAAKDGISIGAVSSYRNFNHQKRIWERKFKRNKAKGLSDSINIRKIIEYSTILGTSRHHWGTDIDIYQTNVKQPKQILVPENFHGNGAYCKLKEWMDKNANTYGFYLVYTDNANRKGFKYEPWHYSYKPLSVSYLKTYRTLNISDILQSEDLLGIDAFTKSFINQYINQNILDINPELL